MTNLKLKLIDNFKLIDKIVRFLKWHISFIKYVSRNVDLADSAIIIIMLFMSIFISVLETNYKKILYSQYSIWWIKNIGS